MSDGARYHYCKTIPCICFDGEPDENVVARRGARERMLLWR